MRTILLVTAMTGLAVEPARTDGPVECEELVSQALEAVATAHHDASVRDRAASPVESPEESCAEASGTREAVERALAPLEDPAIRLLDVDHFDRMVAEWSGQPVVGIGLSEVLSIDIDEGTGRLTVIAPVPGSPAASAGLRAGDVVARIDGTRTDGLGLTRAMERLRVAAGDTVRLEVLRGDRSRRVALGGDSLPELPAMEVERLREGDHDLLVVRLRQFTPGVGEAVGEAVASSAGVDALVLDLRGNPGGFVDALVAVAGVFLEPGSEIARLVGPESAILRASEEGSPTTLPVAVVVDAGTASAAEALAAALSYHGRARIYGERTFGKGLAHNAMPIEEGAWVLMLPVGELVTPDGKRVLGAGVDPDVPAANPLTRAIRDLRDGTRESDVAFVGATVLRMDGSPPLPDATVLVRGDRIATVGPRDSVAVGEGATEVDATGAWLIPGLWDMHVHALFDAELAGPLLKKLLTHGVTGIRDMGGPLDVLVETRERIASGDLPAPRIVASGPALDGPEPVDPSISWSIGSPGEGRTAVDSLADAAVDFVKVYTLLPREAFFAVAEAARERGLPLAGHVPASVTPVEAAEAGMGSVEHLRSEIELFCTSADPSACDPAFAAFREHDVWQTPTLVVRRNRAFLDDSTTVHGPEIQRAPRMLRELWDGIRASRLERGAEYFEGARAHHREERWLAAELHRQGIGILAGSDAGALFTVHGVSLHQELALLVEAGLEPLQALAAATSNAARFLGVDDSLGTIAPGKKADLVLLDADPLADITNTRRIRAVVLDGRMMAREELHLERARAFQSLIRDGRYDAARAMMAPDPRRWWEEREGEGNPWTVGPGGGPWAAWDEQFESRGELVEWRQASDSATAVVRETNDYFRLLERGWVTNEITYFFDGAGRIDGLLIRAAGERPPGRTEEFLTWAKSNEPEELEALMPGGEIDPSGDHPERFRRLLERWRREVGLAPIE